jgi:hypothetical protein
MIEVHLNLRDAPKPLSFESWARWVQERLTAAGIPCADDGSLGSRGMLKRFLDPDDFGGIRYQWIPEEECYDFTSTGDANGHE